MMYLGFVAYIAASAIGIAWVRCRQITKEHHEKP
jgi:hypothetical protein